MKTHLSPASVLLHRDSAEAGPRSRFRSGSCGCLAILLAAITCLASWRVDAGTWSALANPPPAGLNNALLLSDGTVICGDGGQNWFRLTPDIHGSYVNGTWSQIASTAFSRIFYSSQVLTNGKVFVAGGESGDGGPHAELYDPLSNTWSQIPDPGDTFLDSESKMLPNGNVLVAPVLDFGGCVIYNVAGNNWLPAASALNQDEAVWVRLPNDNILTIDFAAQTSEHYVPSLNRWIADGNVPVLLYGFGEELGAGFVLPNGKAFFIGATPKTAIYTPGSSITAAGSWIAGPNIPNNLGAVDAPAAMLPNGKILCAFGPTNGFNTPTSFFEYDYLANSFSQVSGPTGTTYNNEPFASTMLDLPDGNVLFIGGQGTTSLFVYFPGGTPLSAGKPVVNSITQNANGTFHLTGTGLNGISEGAAYGDDWQMGTSYPIVRLVDNAGNVFYARTFNWNNTTIMTGSKVITTEFSLPAGIPAGTYSLFVSANGNSSSSFTFVVGGGSGGGVTIPNGTYKFVDVPGFALDDPNGGGAGTGTDQQTFSGANQTWTVTLVTGTQYKITAANGAALTGSSLRAQLTLQNYTGAANQLWKFIANGAFTNVVNIGTGEAMDDFGGGGAGTTVGQWDYDPSNGNQNWRISSVSGGSGSGVTFFQNVSFGGTASQVLGVGNYTLAQLQAKGVPNDWASSAKVSAGFTVQMFASDNFTGTSWTLTADTSDFRILSPNANDQMTSCKITQGGGGVAGTHVVVNQFSGKALDDPNSSTTDGTVMVQWTKNGGANQSWTFTQNSDGSFTLINVVSGKALDDPNNSPSDGTLIDQWTSDGGNNQHWNVNANGDGSFTILNVSSGKALEDPNSSTANGTQIDQKTSNGGSNQHWLLQ